MMKFNPFTGKLDNSGLKTISNNRAPTSTDISSPPVIWYDTSANDYYLLDSVVSGVATWSAVSGGSGGGGGLVYIGTITGASDATVDIDNTYITTDYDEYELIINNLVPATDGTNLRMLTSTNNGTSFASSGYSYNTYSVQTSASVYGSLSDDRISMTSNSTHAMGNLASEVMSIRVRISRPTDPDVITKIFWSGAYTGTTSDSILLNGAGSHDTAEANDAFRLYMSSGNISTCTINIYGIQNS